MKCDHCWHRNPKKYRWAEQSFYIPIICCHCKLESAVLRHYVDNMKKHLYLTLDHEEVDAV